MSELFTWLANYGQVWRLKTQTEHYLREQQWLWECAQVMSSGRKWISSAEFERQFIKTVFCS